MIDSKLILITLLVKLGVAAAVSSSLVRAKEFKSLLFREERTFRQKLYLVFWFGLPIMIGFRPDGDGWTGRLFDRENGNTYDCHMTLQGPNSLTLRAYVLLPIFGKTQVWRRMPG